jgi:formylglycine-generating enzyme required for sulfatase activity
MEFVRIPRGKFWMGGGSGRPGQEEVTIPYDFYLGKYEVTQGQWQAVMGFNPSYFSRSGAGKEAVRQVSDEDLKWFPVETVDLHAIESFLAVLNKEESGTGWSYCLPMTEEWEYACRGGPTADRSESAFDFYLDRPDDQLGDDQANWGHSKGLNRPCRVGLYPPNRLGLYDMHGNVHEWCDANEPSPHSVPSPVFRSGSWSSASRFCRAGYYQVSPPWAKDNTLGLRVARIFLAQDKPGYRPVRTSR